MKKIIIPGLVAGFIMLVVNMIVSMVMNPLFPNLRSEYMNPNLFRPWSDPKMSLIFICPFILGLALAFVWDKVKSLSANQGLLQRGLQFGLLYWLVALQGMVISYSSFPISLKMVFSWTVAGFIQAVCAGIILAKMNK